MNRQKIILKEVINKFYLQQQNYTVITQEERAMNLYYELVTIKEQIPVSTCKTILGQIVSGDIEGAQTDIRRMKEKLRRQAYDDKKI